MIKKLFLPLAVFLFFFLRTSASDPETWAQGYYEALLTTTVPVIDGVGDDNCWDSAVWKPIDQRWIGPSYLAEDYSGRFKALWTSSRVYLLIEVVDDSLRLQDPELADPCSNIYNYDCVEIFIDEDRSRETDYRNSHKAFAYHMDTTGHVCYANGSLGWERLDENVIFKMRRIAGDTFHYEYEIKVFDDSFVPGGSNTPVTLTDDKLMGWSLAYNDNDLGTTRQNMTGSKFVPGDSDNERNVSYFNASVFGDLKLVTEYLTISHVPEITDPFQSKITNTGFNLIIALQNTGHEGLLIQLFDSTGKECRKSTVGKTTGYTEQSINISGLHRGIYIVKITGLKNQVEKKVVL